MKKRRRVPRLRRYADYTLGPRNGTTVKIRVVPAERIVYYDVIEQGPFFLEDMAELRKTFTRGPGWQFLPRPNPR